MKRIRRAAALALAAVLCLILLAGCEENRQASGLTLSVCLGGAPESLDPVRATSAEDETVIGHLYENLMKVAVDTSGKTTVTAGAAKSYDVDENYDGTVTYTFHLRGAKWSDGAAVTAQDFVYAWQRLANPATNSPNAALLSVVAGYDKVRSTGDVTKLQTEAKNDTTLVVTLTGKCPWFLTDVCTAPATVPLRKDVVKKLKASAQKADEKAAESGQPGTATWCSDPVKLVTNGPYGVGASGDESLLLMANENYRGTFSGPDSIKFCFADTAEDAWALYEAKEVDFVSPLPEEQLQTLAKNADWSPMTELNTCALLFNTAAAPFDDPSARQAFALSIDRSALAGAVSVAAAPAAGLVPAGTPESDGTDFRTAGGDLVDCDPDHYDANCDQARSFLGKAGYDGGFGFPAVRCLYVDEDGHTAAAELLEQMWSDALHIRVTLAGVSEEELEKALQDGDYDLAITDLHGYADDAESFLSEWRSDGECNVVGYSNSAYDTLLTVIDNANDETARIGCLHDAESLLLEDCPLTPLYFTGTAWKLRDGLTGVCRDARGFFSFATVAATASG
jgi:oligopeptide transport system substrate-binding protein